MYKCPNCAGNLKFDIARQQLYCEYCSTQMDPYQYTTEKDAEEGESPSGEYEVTVFRCPQCGSEILSEDTTAATFCSFCGASAILDSRVSRERRPEIILPFTKTKEDCRAAYGKLLRRALFAPRELKDEALIEKFRGIYMPYWVYSFEKKDRAVFPGRKTHRSGDYRITEHYQLDCEVEEEYRGLAYDASSAFSDSLSSAIGPFDLKKGKAFTPSFLSGFYADTSDVASDVYLSDAADLVVQDAAKSLAADPVCRQHGAGLGETRYAFESALRPYESASELAMLPVWFLSYRNGERVSYTVVNGQTGKAAADLPIDVKRYLAGSLILAVPLFFLLNLFLTITPKRILLAAILLAALSMMISNGQINHILARESGEDDKGLGSLRQNFTEAATPSDRVKGTDWRRFFNNPFKKILLVVLIFYVTAVPVIFFGTLLEDVTGIEMTAFIGIAVNLVVFTSISRIFRGGGNRRTSEKKLLGGGHFKEKWPVLGKPLGGIASAIVIVLADPVSDWLYYIGAFVCMGMVLWSIVDIIRQHNRLTMRKLPQLNRRGGGGNG